MNADQLKAGKELDMLIAEQVMGELKPVYTHSPHTDGIPSPGGHWICLPEYDHGDICEWQPLLFSTDIAAAWKVVNHFKEQPIKVQWAFCDAIVEMDINEEFIFWLSPLVICLAALKAVEYTE